MVSDRSGDPGKSTSTASGSGSRMLQMLKVALLMFALGLGAFGVAAWLSGDREPLPLEYEGFD